VALNKPIAKSKSPLKFLTNKLNEQKNESI
jgi:hypothetical protein